MVISAFPKINLYLRVTGKRANGYHEIETLFLPLKSPADQLDIVFSEEEGPVSFSCSDPALEGENNLCFRSAEACRRALGIRTGISIRLEKHIPVAAGMGGGSSDAASVICAFRERFPALPSPEKIALSLGADVPFFLKKNPCVGRGLGEELFPVEEKLSVPPVVIVAPEFPVTAKWAYVHRDISACDADHRTLEELLSALKTGDFEKTARFLRNDLAHAVRAKFPLSGMIEDRLKECGALASQITGSGPTLFGVFPDEEKARKALEAFPGFRTFSA